MKQPDVILPSGRVIHRRVSARTSTPKIWEGPNIPHVAWTYMMDELYGGKEPNRKRPPVKESMTVQKL